MRTGEMVRIAAEEFQRKYGSFLKKACGQSRKPRYDALMKALEAPSPGRDWGMEWQKDLIQAYERLTPPEERKGKALPIFANEKKLLRNVLEDYDPQKELFLENLFKAIEEADSKDDPSRVVLFQKKYQEFFDRLRDIEPESRLEAARKDPQWQDIQVEIWELEENVKEEERSDRVTVILPEALRTYDSEKGAPFLTWYFQKCKWASKQKAGSRDDIMQLGMRMRNLEGFRRILKWIRQADHDASLSGTADLVSRKELFDQYLKEHKIKAQISESQFDEAWEAYRTRIVRINDSPEEENGDSMLPGERELALKYYFGEENKERSAYQYELLYAGLMEVIRYTAMSPEEEEGKTGGKRWENNRTKRIQCIRYYVTREILKALKLRVLTQYERELYMQEKDSAYQFFQECMEEISIDLRKQPDYVSEGQVRHYYKWKTNQAAGKNTPPIPAGNADVYRKLKPYENKILQCFEPDYVETAVREKPENREELYGIYYNLLNEGFRFADSQYNQGHAFKFTKENDRIYEEWAERAAKFLFIMEEEGGLPPKKKDLKTAEAHGENKGER